MAQILGKVWPANIIRGKNIGFFFLKYSWGGTTAALEYRVNDGIIFLDSPYKDVLRAVIKSHVKRGTAEDDIKHLSALLTDELCSEIASANRGVCKLID